MLNATADSYKINFGKYYSENPVSIGPHFIPIENCDEYGVGDNRITTVHISYDEYYKNEHGDCNAALLSSNKERIENKYAIALSSVKNGMNDADVYGTFADKFLPTHEVRNTTLFCCINAKRRFTNNLSGNTICAERGYNPSDDNRMWLISAARRL